MSAGGLRAARRLVRRGLEKSGLIGPYYRMLERRMARNAGTAADDGLPMPPADLLVAVNSSADQAWFSERGRADARHFLDLAVAEGLVVGRPLTVVDFGCGCGRIARWLAPQIEAGGGRFHGSDLNPRLVAWCAANLQGRYTVNDLAPPLDLPDASVDFIYAYSVFTHLAEATVIAWAAELARVLRPDGRAVITFHDEAYARRWGPPEVAPRLASERYVVWNNALEGSNYLSAWTTQARFRELVAPGLDVLRIIPGGGEVPEQAIAVLKHR